MHTTLIDCETLAENLGNSDWVIVDCRYDLMDSEAGRAAWLDSHIAGAVYASVRDDLSGEPVTDYGRHPMPSAETMRATFSRLGIDASKQVVVYDDIGGAFAARLWWMLRYLRHEAVAVLDGGWSAWLTNKNRAVEAGNNVNSKVEFSGEAKTDGLVVIEQVEEAVLLIDSRDPDRYQGKLEPIDRAAGHIPGAINHFWKQNLNEEGHFHSPVQLAENFKLILKNIAAEDVVFYCGSGVTACHNLLAMAHAGLAEPRLYGGSWSEWSSDPQRPVATGLS